MNKEDKIRQTYAQNKWNKRTNSSFISELYPEVLEITLDLKLDYPNAFSKHQHHSKSVFTPTDKAYFVIDCINRDCLYSDLSLDVAVNKTIKEKLQQSEGTKTCNGFNTFNCYEKGSGTCMTKLDYMIKIKYKNAL